MKRILTILGILVAVVLVGGLVSLAVMPGGLSVVRTAVVEAPAAAVFAEVDDLRRWQGWSPWAARDETLEVGFEGEATGVGARMVWTGEASGSGEQVIVVSEPGARVELDVAFAEMGPARSVWTFVEKRTPAADGEDGAGAETVTTVVTWGLEGELEGIAKLLGPAVRRGVEADFDAGLARLKALVEGAGGA